MTDKLRGFEVVSKYINEDGTTDIQLPIRGSSESAGYDFMSAVDITIPSIWDIINEVTDGKIDYSNTILNELDQNSYSKEEVQAMISKHFSDYISQDNITKLVKPTLVPTGIKAYMQSGEVLVMPSRSSLPLKKYLILPNGLGVIDQDYYNNEDNEGEIFCQFINFGLTPCVITKGERLTQGIFLPFLPADTGNTDILRTGGHGSTGGYGEDSTESTTAATESTPDEGLTE